MTSRLNSSFRFWLAEHAAPLGLLLALLAVIVVLGSFVYLVSPRGPSEQVKGVVVALGLSETDTGSQPRAVVKLATSQVSVSLPRGHDCKAGSTIVLRRSHSTLGYRYGAPKCGD